MSDDLAKLWGEIQKRDANIVKLESQIKDERAKYSQNQNELSDCLIWIRDHVVNGNQNHINRINKVLGRN